MERERGGKTKCCCGRERVREKRKGTEGKRERSLSRGKKSACCSGGASVVLWVVVSGACRGAATSANCWVRCKEARGRRASTYLTWAELEGKKKRDSAGADRTQGTQALTSEWSETRRMSPLEGLESGLLAVLYLSW